MCDRVLPAFRLPASALLAGMLLAGALLAALPVAGVASPPAAEPYVDRLIDPDSPASADAIRDAEEEARRATPGLEATLLETRLYHDRRSGGFGSATETGVLFQHRRETVNHGDWLIDGAAQTSRSGREPWWGGDDSRRRARILLQQQALPLRGGWSMTNSLGVLRLPAPGRGDYLSRFPLPGGMVAGVAAQGNGLRRSIYAGAGETARIDGGQGLGWRSSGGFAAGAGWRDASLAVNGDDVFRSVDIASVRGDRHAPDNVTAALSYGRELLRTDPASGTPASLRWQYRLLADDHGRAGHSVDARLRRDVGAWSGALWHFEPDLQWFDTRLSSGQRGGSLRYDHADPSLYWSLGGDLTRDRPYVAGWPALTGRALFGSVGTRAGLGRSIGLSLQWRDVSASGGVTGALDGERVRAFDSTQRSVSVFYARSLREYAERWQWTVARQDSPGRDATVMEVTWNGDLTLHAGGDLGLLLGLGQQATDGASIQWRPSAGISWSLPAADRWRVNASVRYSRDSADDLSSYNWAGALRVGYALSRRWEVGVDAGLNQASSVMSAQSFQDTPLFAAPQTLRSRDRSVWLTLRFQDQGGVPYATLTGSGGRGAGAVAGTVFHDENRDGVRQSGERPAANVTLVLDNGQTVRTDAFGQYEFPIVGVGRRRVVVDPESVRLPWEVAPDTAQRVEVRLRGRETLNIPLRRISE